MAANHPLSNLLPTPFMRPLTPFAAALIAALASSAIASPVATAQEYLNGIEWTAPSVVDPGESDTSPPSDATVIFDGADLSNFKG